MHPILKTISILILFYLLYCTLLYILQRQMLFPRSQIQIFSSTKDDIPGLEKTWLDTDYGKVEAWFMPPDEANKKPYPAVIFGHGNAELIDVWPEYLTYFTHLGIGVLLVEYPGYGRSEGTPSQESITAVFTEAYDMLVDREGVDVTRIILFGRSVGGGAVCSLAAVRPTSAIILMSTFTSVRSFATRYLVPGFLVRDPFDNLSVIRTYAGPVCIIHGKYDEIIPYAHGMALHQAAPQSRIITYNSGHNDCPPDWQVFWQDLELFLRDIEIIPNKRVTSQ